VFRHYLITALRNFWRFRSATAVNLVCLALGLACVVLTYSTIAFVSRVDESLLRSSRVWLMTVDLRLPFIGREFLDSPNVGHIVGDYLKVDYPKLAVARRTSDLPMTVNVNGTPLPLRASFADPAFLDLVRLPLASRSAPNPLSIPRSALIAERAADRLFGTRNVLGRTLRLANLEDVTITGVVGALPEPSHFRFDVVASMDTYDAIMARPDAPDFTSAGLRLSPEVARWVGTDETYVELPPDGSIAPSEFREELKRFAARHVPELGGTSVSFGIMPVGRYFVNTYNSYFAGSSGTGLKLTTMAYFLAAMVLVVACVNYSNLAAALAAARAKEVGLRRVVGARRQQIIGQHLFEAALIGIVALVLVLAFAALLVPLIRQTGIEIGWDVLVQPQFLGLMLLLVCAVTILGGTYPAWVLSSFRPVRTLRGETFSEGGRIPKILAVLQFTASSFLLVMVFIVQAQNGLIRKASLLFEEDPVMRVDTSLAAAKVDYERFRAQLMTSPLIASVTASSFPPANFFVPAQQLARTADPAAPRLRAADYHVTYDFFSTLGIELLAGRDFSRDRGDDVTTGGWKDWKRPPHVIVDDALTRQFGWEEPAAAVGQSIFVSWAGETPMPMEIIGVVRSKMLGVVGMGATANMYLLMPAESQCVTVRLSRQDVPKALAYFDAVWREAAPEHRSGRQFLNDVLEVVYRQFMAVTGALAGLAFFALLIGAVGLFGMAVHVSQRRTHEIGVRKTLGARASQIVFLLMRDFSWPVILANLIAWPLAFLGARVYLSLFVDRAPLSPVPFLAALAITLVVAWLAIVSQTVKASRLKPGSVLRYE
jgi:putative ABC transport system permease protein